MTDTDGAGDFQDRVLDRLTNRQIIWLVTTGETGRPQPSPVWFLWGGGEQPEGSSLVVYSRPDAPKIRNITARPAVALHFDTDPAGHEVVVLNGQARLDPAPLTDAELATYVAKYTGGIAEIGMTPESMVAEYSALIRVTIERVRGF